MTNWRRKGHYFTKKMFSHENHVYQLLFGIRTLLSISYDEFRRTKKERPRGGLNLKIQLTSLSRRA
jgi:hypothetical protein